MLFPIMGNACLVFGVGFVVCDSDVVGIHLLFSALGFGVCGGGECVDLGAGWFHGWEVDGRVGLWSGYIGGWRWCIILWISIILYIVFVTLVGGCMIGMGFEGVGSPAFLIVVGSVPRR